MSAFLKSIDSKTWKEVLKGWEHLVALDKDGNKTVVLKLEEEWSTTEDELALGNSKALNALFNGVDKNMFRLIKNALWLRMLGKFSKMVMRVHLKLKFQDFNFLLQNLKI